MSEVQAFLATIVVLVFDCKYEFNLVAFYVGLSPSFQLSQAAPVDKLTYCLVLLKVTLSLATWPGILLVALLFSDCYCLNCLFLTLAVLSTLTLFFVLKFSDACAIQ